MFRKIIIVSICTTITFIGCSYAPGEDHPQGISNYHYPNNGAYGPDAMPYTREEFDASTTNVIDASVDAPTCIDVTQCGTKQCGAIPNQCGGFMVCPDCDHNDECVNNVCRAKHVCNPENDNSFCNRFNKNCGTHTGLDNCGTQRTVNDCGGVCAGVCFNNACCIPDPDPIFCAKSLPATQECGFVNAIDNCGVARTPDCTCVIALTTCVANKCEPKGL